MKERREQETRKVAEDLHNYLDFADVDWDNIQPGDFVQINFEEGEEPLTQAPCSLQSNPFMTQIPMGQMCF